MSHVVGKRGTLKFIVAMVTFGYHATPYQPTSGWHSDEYMYLDRSLAI